MKRLIFEEDPKGEYSYFGSEEGSTSVFTKGCHCDSCKDALHFRLVEDEHQIVFRMTNQSPWDITYVPYTESEFKRRWPNIVEFRKIEEEG